MKNLWIILFIGLCLSISSNFFELIQGNNRLDKHIEHIWQQGKEIALLKKTLAIQDSVILEWKMRVEILQRCNDSMWRRMVHDSKQK